MPAAAARYPFAKRFRTGRPTAVPWPVPTPRQRCRSCARDRTAPSAARSPVDANCGSVPLHSRPASLSRSGCRRRLRGARRLRQAIEGEDGPGGQPRRRRPRSPVSSCRRARSQRPFGASSRSTGDRRKPRSRGAPAGSASPSSRPVSTVALPDQEHREPGDFRQRPSFRSANQGLVTESRISMSTGGRQSLGRQNRNPAPPA